MPFKATDPLHTKSLHMNVWKVEHTNSSPCLQWENATRRQQAPPHSQSHIPAHAHLLRTGAKQGQMAPVCGLGLLCLVSTPWYLLPHSGPQGCNWSLPSGEELLFPTSAWGVTVSGKQDSGSYQSPCTCWDPHQLQPCCIHQGVHQDTSPSYSINSLHS